MDEQHALDSASGAGVGQPLPIIESCSSSATSPPQYKLSGVGYRARGSGFFEVPPDKDLTYRQGRRRSRYAPEIVTLNCECGLDFRCDRADLHCYKFHAHCWSLIEWIIGPLAEERLDLLIAALRARWKEYPFKTDRLARKWPSHLAWLGFCLESPLDPLTATSSLSYKERVTPLADPLRVQILPTLVKRSRKRRNRRMGPPRITRAKISSMRVFNTRPMTLDLPLDIQRLILDYLCLRDLGNAAVAFHWQLPDSYWRYRFPCDLIWELGNIPPEDLDWPYLCTEVGPLMESSRALQNRERIVKLLRRTRDRFFEIVEQERNGKEREDDLDS